MDSLVEIRKSNDYGWFKFLPTNRTVGTSDKVKMSVETFDVTPYVPIIVTEDGFIIDGQNRYEVCKSLGKPIYYVVYDGEFTPEQVMVALNTAAKPWAQEEWFQHYVKMGLTNYVKLYKMSQTHSLGLSNNILLFSNGKSSSVEFKAGKLTDDSRFYIRVVEWCKGCEVPFKTFRPFVSAALRFIESHEDSPRRISLLQKKVVAVPKFSSTAQFLTAFENLTERR